MLKKHKNKIIILSAFLIVIMAIFYLTSNKKKKLKEISEDEAKQIIIDAFHDEHIEKINDQALVLSKNDRYMLMVVGEEYVLTDFSDYPPKIHHYKSNKPDIKVKIVEIKDNGFLVDHGDHQHFIYEKLDKKYKVGDYIYIKDPHSYLKDRQLDKKIK